MNARARFVAIKLLLLTMLVLGPFATQAQDNPEPAGTPNPTSVLISIHQKDKEDGTRFEAEVEPGESQELTAVMTNFGAVPLELRAYSANVIPATNGGLRLADRETEPSGTSLWMSFAEEEFTLQPGESIEQPLTISVPEDTAPGQYVNAVALETVNPVEQSETSSFDQYFRKVVSVYITVPGEMSADFELGEPEVLVLQGRSGIQIPITNTGNVRIDVVGDLTITSLEGNIVHEGRVQLGPIYNGQETMLQVGFSAVPPPGEYQLTYNLRDATSGVERSVDAVPVEVPEDTSGEPAPIAFENVVVEPNADPIVFANVSVDVGVATTAYRSTRLTLSIYRDGEFVEDFVMADNLSLAQGTTTVTQRYLPETNWESGTYTFSLKLESTEGDSISLLLEEEDVATLEVP